MSDIQQHNLAKKFVNERKEQAIDLLVHNINQYQSSDSYWYEHSKVNVIWSLSDEAYIFINQKDYNNKTVEYYSPSDLDDGIRNELSDQDLIEFMIDQNNALVDYEEELEINKFLQKHNLERKKIDSICENKYKHNSWTVADLWHETTLEKYKDIADFKDINGLQIVFFNKKRGNYD